MSKISLIVYSLVTFIVTSGNVGASPSFNCKKASTVVEKHICNLATYSKSNEHFGNDLQRYDTLMHDLYEKVSNIGNVKVDQKKWLKARNQCASNFKQDSDFYSLNRCLMKRYKERVDELFNLSIKPKYMNTLRINKNNSCKLITGNSCTNVNVLSTGSKLIYVVRNRGKIFIVEASKEGNINWKSLGLFNQYISIRNAIWQNKTEKSPEHIRFIGDYRSGCPDCGTQDRIMVKINNVWQDIDLRYYYLHYGLFSDDERELDVEIDVDTGMLIIKSSTEKYRDSQAEDLGYFISKGKLVGNTFMPSSIETIIY